jgi:hypothetical protein
MRAPDAPACEPRAQPGLALAGPVAHQLAASAGRPEDQAERQNSEFSRARDGTWPLRNFQAGKIEEEGTFLVDPIASDSPGRSMMRTISPAALKQRQMAAVKHGLYVKSPPGKRRHQYRAGRLLSRMLTSFATRGTPLSELQVPIARSWCEMHVLASDLYAALAAGEGGDKGIQHYLSIRRIQLAHAIALGMSPTSETHMARELAKLAREVEATHALRSLDKYQFDSPRKGAQ